MAPGADVVAALGRGGSSRAAGAATAFARDIENQPANLCTPSALAKHARKFAQAEMNYKRAILCGLDARGADTILQSMVTLYVAIDSFIHSQKYSR